MSEHVKYLTEADIVSVVSPADAVDALRKMLLEKASGEAQNVPKSLGAWTGGAMHSLGSVMHGAGFAGFKTWVRTDKGGGSIFTLFNAETGKLLALLEARALGLLRTSAITGVATDLLAPQDAKIGCIIGTGDQASMQLRAMSAVRTFSEVRVFSPTPERRASFCERQSQRYEFPLIPCESAEAAMDGADIVTTITRASEPFIHADMLSTCKLFVAVGAILPKRAEFHQDVFDKASRLVVDDLENARRGSREFREKFGDDLAGWKGVETLDKIVAHAGQPPEGDGLTLFKGMGMGLSDLAVASLVCRRAHETDTGLSIAPQTRENLLEADLEG